MRGAGIWLRAQRPRVEDAIEHLDHVCVPLHSGERGHLVVGPSLREWLAEYRAAGGVVWAWDWLPLPGQTEHIEALCDEARTIGAEGICSDIEPDVGWRGRVREAVAYRAALAEHRGGLDLAITDYARGGIGDAALGALLAEVGGHRPIGVPQSYDPAGRYEPGYHQRSVDYWRGLGAERVVLGVGGWLRSERRHRTPAEMRRHLEHIPEGLHGLCAWYASRGPLEALLPVLGEHRAPAAVRPTLPAPETLRAELVADLEAMATRAKDAEDQGAVAELLRCAERLSG